MSSAQLQCTHTEGDSLPTMACAFTGTGAVRNGRQSLTRTRTYVAADLSAFASASPISHTWASVRAGSDDVCGRKVDVYAFGILLWCLHNGKRAYEDLNTYQIMFRKSAAFMLASSFSRFQPTDAFST